MFWVWRLSIVFATFSNLLNSVLDKNIQVQYSQSKSLTFQRTEPRHLRNCPSSYELPLHTQNSSWFQKHSKTSNKCSCKNRLSLCQVKSKCTCKLGEGSFSFTLAELHCRFMGQCSYSKGIWSRCFSTREWGQLLPPLFFSTMGEKRECVLNYDFLPFFKNSFFSSY